MKEAYGSLWIFSVCATFIILITAYLAISVNYAKAFRTKDYVIQYIEEMHGYSQDMDNDIKDYLVSQGYSSSGYCSPHIQGNDSVKEDTNWKLVAPIDLGLPNGDKHHMCIYKQEVSSFAGAQVAACKAYYKVVTFFRFDLPVLSHLLVFKIGGDSKLIYDFEDTNCYRE